LWVASIGPRRPRTAVSAGPACVSYTENRTFRSPASDPTDVASRTIQIGYLSPLLKLVTESLGECIERIETNRKTLRVCNASEEAELGLVTSFFDPHDLEVEIVDAAGRPSDTVSPLAEGRRVASSPSTAAVR